MVGKVRQRVINRADQQILAIIQSRYRFFHATNFTALVILCPPPQVIFA
jgi:hypothetical protein